MGEEGQYLMRKNTAWVLVTLAYLLDMAIVTGAIGLNGRLLIAYIVLTVAFVCIMSRI